MSRFWSPLVSTLAPYVPGEQPQGRVFVKLNTNENPFGPAPTALAAMRAATDDSLRLYPDPTAAGLRAAIAGDLGLGPDQVFVGNGSDEVLAHAFNAFFRDRGDLLFPAVSYSFYPTYCRLYGIPVRQIAMGPGLTIAPDDYRGAPAGVVIANPNAPTGVALDLSQIRRILTANPDVVVLVDEAYVDFGAESAVGLIAEFDNLLVVQTFSKSRSLAGLRVGMAMGQAHLIEGLVRVKDSFNSYPLGRIALAGAEAAWRDRDWFETTRQAVIAERSRVSAALAVLGFDILPSTANFVFAGHPGHDAAALLAGLRARGVLVRHFARPEIADRLRISIGAPQENDALIAALTAIVAPV